MLYHRRDFINSIEKDVNKSSFKELKPSPSKMFFQKDAKSYDILKDSQVEQIKCFLFNEKYFHNDVSRCVIAPQHIQHRRVDSKVVSNMVLSHVMTFTTTIREVALFSFDSEIGEPYNPKTKDEILMPTLKLYILDGKHTILVQKIILDNKKY